MIGALTIIALALGLGAILGCLHPPTKPQRAARPPLLGVDPLLWPIIREGLLLQPLKGPPGRIRYTTLYYNPNWFNLWNRYRDTPEQIELRAKYLKESRAKRIQLREQASGR